MVTISGETRHGRFMVSREGSKIGNSIQNSTEYLSIPTEKDWFILKNIVELISLGMMESIYSPRKLHGRKTIVEFITSEQNTIARESSQESNCMKASVHNSLKWRIYKIYLVILCVVYLHTKWSSTDHFFSHAMIHLFPLHPNPEVSEIRCDLLEWRIPSSVAMLTAFL